MPQLLLIKRKARRNKGKYLDYVSCMYVRCWIVSVLVVCVARWLFFYFIGTGRKRSGLVGLVSMPPDIPTTAPTVLVEKYSCI